MGLNLKSTQKSLLKEGNNLSITETLHVAETEEATLKQVEVIQNTQSASQIPEEKTQDTHAIKAGREYYNNSYFCEKGHYRGECPAKGKTCRKCQRTGHFAVACRTRDMKASTRKRDGPPRPTKTPRNRNTHNITTPSNEEDNHLPTEAYFYTISGPKIAKSHNPADAREAYAELRVGNKMSQIEINAKVDTDAMSNLIPWECFKQLNHVHLPDTLIRLFAN